MRQPSTVATEQIDTTPTTTREIMGSVGFAAGVHDVRGGRPARFDAFVVFENDNLWSYERGRLWAYLAPMSMPLYIRGKLNREAVRLFDMACFRGEIL